MSSVSVDLGLYHGVTDEDSPDPRTYSLVTSAYSNLFNISSTTGVIYYAVNYDIDVLHPQNLSLIVKCTDNHGLTGTNWWLLLKLIQNSLTYEKFIQFRNEQ